ncbi:aspartate aminotransferase family protein [uncultured Bradyrhizobium sp.]|uniref:aspartate aminotransferase family protein n=1 Tax=uncultured Bradyrhizobium sp. TaxID=199684 RepID=UPI0035CAC464
MRLESPRSSNVFPRQIGLDLPIVDHGKGAYIIDTDGREYLDASGGPAVSCLGHDDPDVIAAIKEQVDRIAFAHTSYFTSLAAETLADLIIGEAPAGFGKLYLTGSGSEAVEASLKMARQYFVQSGLPSKTKFIARHQSYHGATLGAVALGGVEWRRSLYAPLTMQCGFIPPCYAYRMRHAGESDEAYGLRAANALETEILHLGPENVAGFIAETIVGATSGAVAAVPGYFARIRKICDRYNVLLILDEVMCGMGRTGSTFSCQDEGVAPDLICVAKGLAGGYQAIAAVVVSNRVYDAFIEGDGIFHHGQTYMGHPVACAAALAVQRKIRDRDLLANVVKQGGYLMNELKSRLAQHPFVGDIRGRGLFVGIELVVDRPTKAPFNPAVKLHKRVKQAAFNRGLICYPGGGTIDGRRGDHILVSPPFIVTRSDIDRIIDLLIPAIDDAVAGAKCSSMSLMDKQ